MAQLRAKQIKLSAVGDLLVGGVGGNGESLAIGAEGFALKVVDGGLAYAGFADTEISFSEATWTSTNVHAAILEAVTKASALTDGLNDEVDAIETSVGLNADGTLPAFTGDYVVAAASHKAAIEALDVALKAVDTAYKAADVVLTDAVADVAADLATEIARATGEEADIRVDFAAADAAEVIARDAAIAVETDRAVAAEEDLQAQIDLITGLSALNFKGEVAGDITSEDLALLGAVSGDVYRVITVGSTDFAGTGLEVNIGDFVAYTGTNWVKFDNTDPSITEGNAIVITGNAHDGFVVGVDNSALSFAALSDAGTPAAGFLKWDATNSVMTYVAALAISDITGLQTALDDLAAADVTLQGNIDAEETRALAAEGVLQGNIDAEEARALAAEGALDLRIDALEAADVTVFGSDEFIGTDAFVLSETPVAGSVVASVNGLVIKPSLVTVTGATVTFGSLGYALDAGDEVVFSYSNVVVA
jgi:hypothetical protein